MLQKDPSEDQERVKHECMNNHCDFVTYIFRNKTLCFTCTCTYPGLLLNDSSTTKNMVIKQKCFFCVSSITRLFNWRHNKIRKKTFSGAKKFLIQFSPIGKPLLHSLHGFTLCSHSRLCALSDKMPPSA